MSLSTETAVGRMIEARKAAAKLAPLSAEGAFSLDEAYALQDAFREAMVRQGEAPIGWKLAATGPTGQALFGVTEPIYGFLPAEIYHSGDTVSAGGFAGMHVEAEFAFTLGRDLAGPGVTADDAFAAIADVRPALELPDLLFESGAAVTDAIANTALGKAIIVGEPVTGIGRTDLAGETVTFLHNGETASTNNGAELLGDPVNALSWLANKLAARGLSLKAGDLIMSGAVSDLLAAKPGDTFEARYTRLGHVRLDVVD